MAGEVGADRLAPPSKRREGAGASWADWAERPRVRGFGLFFCFSFILNF
jgi:hypothetical protein